MKRLLVLLAVSLPLFAQYPRESVTIEVVDVPVYVSRGGSPVTNLTRDNFELYVNGKPQAIEYFEAANGEMTALRDRRLYLLLFDVAFADPHAILRAQRAATHLIANAQPGDYYAVATYSQRRGVWFATPFTQDREALVRGIVSLNNSRSGDPLSIVITESERPAAPENEALRIADESLRDIAHMQTFRAAQDQVLNLADLADRLGSLEGQKHVVLLSEGFEQRSPSPVLYRDLQEMEHAFQESDVFLHALDLEGVPGTFQGIDSLQLLTEGTHGKLMHGRNDLGNALVDLSRNLDRGYRLGFRAADVRTGHNTIQVKVRADRMSGLTVRHRQGFSGTAERVNVDDGLYLADVVLNDVPQTGTAAKLEANAGKLVARIPMREVAAQLASGGKAELLVYAFNAEGHGLMYHREAIRVDDVDEKDVEIELPAGTKVAKALLRVDGSLGFSKTVM